MADQKEEPGFEADVNELPEGTNRSEHTLEGSRSSDDGSSNAMGEAHEDAAEERKKGGYQ